MVERNVSWEFIFVALVITGAIMVGMFFMGLTLSERKVSSLEKEMDELRLERSSQDLSREVASSLPAQNCEALNVAVRQTVADVSDLQQQVETFEQSDRLGNGDFTTLKKRYTNLLIEYWLTVKKLEEQCGSDVVTVLYLYHNEQECPACEDQGTLLSFYREQYDDRLLVFPLDASIGMRPVNLIKDAYGVDQYPSLIINGENYTGYQDREELGNILERHMNETVA